MPDTTISGALVPKPTITDPTITGAMRMTTANPHRSLDELIRSYGENDQAADRIEDAEDH